MNKIVLLGRLTREPEVRYTTTGKVVCQFTLAVDRPFANQDGQREADFINIVVWGKIAEICGNSLGKGHRALVEGRLQIRSYEKDGKKHYVTEVIAGAVYFVMTGTVHPSTHRKLRRCETGALQHEAQAGQLCVSGMGGRRYRLSGR